LHSLPFSAIIPDMKTAPVFPPGYLNALSKTFLPCIDRPYVRVEDHILLPLGLVACTGAIALHLAFYGGKALLARIRRHVSPPEPLSPAAPGPAASLRGAPTPEDIEDAWFLDPRTLPARLRIGSRLADLEPTLDARFVFRKTRSGSRRIVARQPGLKGWLRKNAPDVKYPTAMHYKKLATRLRQLIGLDARIPLEWLLPDNRESLSALTPADRRNAAAAKAKLDRLLADNPKLTRLARAVESRLGIMRMVTIRRIQPPKPGRGKRRKPRENAMNPLISRVTRAGYAYTADDARARAFWDALRKILGERTRDPETLRLQSDIRAWLNAPLQARLNRRR
jgi:hypothetical protein